MKIVTRLTSSRRVSLPKLTDEWFGKESSSEQRNEPQKFTISISDSELKDLNDRLDRFRNVESLPGSNFEYGMNSETLSQIVHYWREKYDWRKCEKILNSYQQFKVSIEGIDVHYVHVKASKESGAVPIMLIHGWPGCFFEFYKIIPLLSEAGFEVILPSIPGYGFSEAPHQRGFTVISAARIFVKLMKQAGFERFVIHGGDWGAVISRVMALLYPENILGIHTTFHLASNPRGSQLIPFLKAKYFPTLMFGKQSTQRELFGKLQKFPSKWFAESGYYHLQSTKPDSLGFALNDSPVGLAAYVLEKFSSWTNLANVDEADGGLGEKFTLDELLTIVMIYWFSGNITSSMRFYKENLCPRNGIYSRYKLSSAVVRVPAGFAVFPNELAPMPRFVLELTYANLIQYSEVASGGHFGALEEPNLLANDLKQFITTILRVKLNK